MKEEVVQEFLVEPDDNIGDAIGCHRILELKDSRPELVTRLPILAIGFRSIDIQEARKVYVKGVARLSETFQVKVRSSQVIIKIAKWILLDGELDCQRPGNIVFVVIRPGDIWR